MPRLEPATLDSLPEDLVAVVKDAEAYMGFIANDALAMAHKPEYLRVAGPFMRAIYGEGDVSFELKRLLGMMSSWAAGCQYCVAHTAHGAAKLGTAEAKIAALPSFETSPLFDAAERAALRVARGAGQTPNGVTDAEFAALKEHYSVPQVVEIVAVIALFGFLNRWNATLATELEASPLQFAQRTLAGTGWQAGVHAASGESRSAPFPGIETTRTR
ncbi:MAG TPA: carboxymuconolactone decarboxylase family protein [Steroidobacteraceae bacterium]|nr:carboxymuconolactone decarboxylase family protein [Steroidobacteraceae bacterium]HRX90938.1 carboxymuconolactone decarboxylase family protein [Steroidobacteraceae bacterium]